MKAVPSLDEKSIRSYYASDGFASIQRAGEYRSLLVTELDEKPLRAAPPIIRAARGMIRDQKTRREVMFVLLLVALALLFSGSTFLQSALDPRERPIWFILFWIVCGWVTLVALLLGIFDLLVAKVEARKARRISREESSRCQTPGPPESGTAK